jgi:hypothetical protein
MVARRTLAVTAVAGFDWLCKSDLATATSVHRFVRRALSRASLLVALVEHVNLGSKSAGPKLSIKATSLSSNEGLCNILQAHRSLLSSMSIWSSHRRCDHCRRSMNPFQRKSF